MNDAQFLALLAAVCACIPGRNDTNIAQDIAMAQEFLESALRETAANTDVVGSGGAISEDQTK